MPTDDKPIVTCGKCGATIDEDSGIRPEERVPCPNCDSVDRKYLLHAEVKLESKATAKMKGYRGDASKRNWFVQIIEGVSLYLKTGKWNIFKRTMDREKDLYDEEFTDPDTGEVIHKCTEPLSKHTGHGDARKQKKR